MAMSPRRAVLLAMLSAASMLTAATARAQSITTEAAVTAGASTDSLAAGALQLRGFGDIPGGIRFFGEASFAQTSDDDGDNDGFAAAYPYGGRLEVIEAYAERMFRPNNAIIGVRAGRFRTPFGIYSSSDHAYTGFLRPPLIRYDEYSGISNYFLEHGADFVVGVSGLQVETALGAPADVGRGVRRPGLDAIVRVQGYYGPIIAGVSHIRTKSLQSADEDSPSDFTGVDLRFTHGGVQLRGEWMTGRPFEGATTTGWYADAIVHLVPMGPVTAVARVERMGFEEPAENEDETLGRQTIGARVRIAGGFSVNVNLVHRTGELGEYKPTSLDVGITWSGRYRP
jgi:hypothetical protein